MRYNPTDMLRDIGKKIKNAREEQGISQKDLGMSLGLSDKAISAYEASRTIPPLETLIRIAEELNKPLDYFIKDNSPDYKVETRIATMEQKVGQLLKEISLIREDLNLSPSESAEESLDEPSETEEKPLETAVNEDSNLNTPMQSSPDSPPDLPQEPPSDQ